MKEKVGRAVCSITFSNVILSYFLVWEYKRRFNNKKCLINIVYYLNIYFIQVKKTVSGTYCHII